MPRIMEISFCSGIGLTTLPNIRFVAINKRGNHWRVHGYGAFSASIVEHSHTKKRSQFSPIAWSSRVTAKHSELDRLFVLYRI